MKFVMTQPAADKVEVENDNDDLAGVTLMIKRTARGWHMPNANFHSVFNGLSLGTVPLAYLAHVQALATDLFPQHHLTFVQREGDVQLLIYPRLTKDEEERWEEAVEDLFRDLDGDKQG